MTSRGTFWIRRYHVNDFDWTLYEFIDTGDRYMIPYSIIASSTKHDMGLGSMSKGILAKDLREGQADFVKPVGVVDLTRWEWTRLATHGF